MNKRVTVGEYFREFGKYGSRGLGDLIGGSGNAPATQSDSFASGSGADAGSGSGAGSSAGGSMSGSTGLCSKGEIWKLKDWPPSADFKTTFPELYEDFSNVVPAPDYVRRDGTLNIASHFPENAVAPDLGEFFVCWLVMIIIIIADAFCTT